MKSSALSLLLTLIVSVALFAGPIRQNSKRNPPTRLARFEVGAFVNTSGKLIVNVDKELGGRVSIQLLDRKGRVYFKQMLYADEELARLCLDLSHLTTDEYILKVSNGLEIITRDIRISPVEPVINYRSVTIL